MIEEWMWLVWLIIAILSLILEAATAAVVSIWFACGAGIALIVSCFPSAVPFWGEIIIFAGSSLLAFLAFRPFISRWMDRRGKTKSNVESLIGRKGIVTEECSGLTRGRVAIDGLVWTAECQNESLTFAQGEACRILAITGNRLIIGKIEEGEK